MAKVSNAKLKFISNGYKIRVDLEWSNVTKKTDRAKKRFMFKIANRLRKKAAKSFIPKKLDRRNPDYYADPKSKRPVTNPLRLRKTKSRKYGRPYDYTKKIPKSMAFKVVNKGYAIVGPQASTKKKNILGGIPRSVNKAGRKVTTPAVLTFGGIVRMADRDVPGKPTLLTTVNEWRAEGMKQKRDVVKPRPYMQIAMDKILKQKSTLKAFKIK